MNNIITINIKKCRAGMKVAETIFNNYGAVIVAENTVIDDFMIDKLNSLGIEKIKIFQVEDSEIEDYNKFEEQYNVNINAVMDIIEGINSGKDLEIDKVNEVVNSLIETSNENRDILSCLRQVRDADQYTYTHCINVSLLSMMIGKWLKLGEKKVQDLVYAGLLHDIGKARIDKKILNKPGKLTFEEFEEMKKHVIYGKEILESMPEISQDIISGVITHHERENGVGYPMGLVGSQIHEYGKIIAVADVYDALTSNRVYRARECVFDVFEHIQISSFGELEPNVVLTFLGYISSYYIGSFCKLSNNETAEIIYINSNNISKPLVKTNSAYIDLSKESGIKIVELL